MPFHWGAGALKIYLPSHWGVVEKYKGIINYGGKSQKNVKKEALRGNHGHAGSFMCRVKS